MAPDNTGRSSRWERATAILAAAFIVASGVVHLQQYYGVYFRVIPTIGPLFVADFVLALVIGLALLAPLDRLSRVLGTLTSLGGIAFAAGAIIGLEISESGTLFGFHEHGYRMAVVDSIVFEGAAIVALVANLAVRSRRRAQPVTSPGSPYPARESITLPDAADHAQRDHEVGRRH
jgi:hypothetical protein